MSAAASPNHLKSVYRHIRQYHNSAIEEDTVIILSVSGVICSIPSIVVQSGRPGAIVKLLILSSVYREARDRVKSTFASSHTIT